MDTTPADGLIAASWLLIALPLAGAAVLLLGGRRTDRWGHLLGTGTVVAAFVLGLLCTLQLGGRRLDVDLVRPPTPLLEVPWTAIGLTRLELTVDDELDDWEAEYLLRTRARIRYAQGLPLD